MSPLLGNRNVKSHTSLTSSWEGEIDYAHITKDPYVHAYLAGQRLHGSRINSERLLDTMDKMTYGVVFTAKAGQALARKLHISSGAEREVTVVGVPCGKVLVAILAHMIHKGIEIVATEQFDEGCMLRCIVPPNLRTLAGELEVGVEKSKARDCVEVIAKVTFHQKFDLGRGKDVLDKLISAAQNGI